MNIALCAGIATVGEKCLGEYLPLSENHSSKPDVYDYRGTFDRGLPVLPNPYCMTPAELAEYIEHITGWPVVVELQDGGAAIFNAVMLETVCVLKPDSFGDDQFGEYVLIKYKLFNVVDRLQTCHDEIVLNGHDGSDELSYTEDLLVFFEAMARGDRFYVDHFIRTFPL